MYDLMNVNPDALADSTIERAIECKEHGAFVRMIVADTLADDVLNNPPNVMRGSVLVSLQKVNQRLAHYAIPNVQPSIFTGVRA